MCSGRAGVDVHVVGLLERLDERWSACGNGWVFHESPVLAAEALMRSRRCRRLRSGRRSKGFCSLAQRVSPEVDCVLLRAKKEEVASSTHVPGVSHVVLDSERKVALALLETILRVDLDDFDLLMEQT